MTTWLLLEETLVDCLIDEGLPVRCSFNDVVLLASELEKALSDTSMSVEVMQKDAGLRRDITQSDGSHVRIVEMESHDVDASTLRDCLARSSAYIFEV